LEGKELNEQTRVEDPDCVLSRHTELERSWQSFANWN